MSERLIPGPIIDRPNVVLHHLKLYSVVERLASTSNYHKVEVGFQEGDYTTWIGEWDQSEGQAHDRRA